MSLWCINIQHDDGRGNGEKKIQQMIAGESGKSVASRISGDGRKADGSGPAYKESQRSEGTGWGAFWISGQEGSGNFGINEEDEAYGGWRRDDNEVIPNGVRCGEGGSQRSEYGEGKSNSAKGDRKSSTHKEDGKSIEDSLDEEDKQNNEQISTKQRTNQHRLPRRYYRR